ncbi:hypothetical protein MXD62_03590, partial [Frankia sp. Mgl5]|nr:hypothetical protein [Frankia sp. Mgl5]
GRPGCDRRTSACGALGRRGPPGGVVGGLQGIVPAPWVPGPARARAPAPAHGAVPCYGPSALRGGRPGRRPSSAVRQGVSRLPERPPGRPTRLSVARRGGVA